MTQEVKTVYLAGKITGDTYYWSKFYEAECELKAAGFSVANPALLPDKGFTYEDYMHMSSAMLDRCKAVCFLPDWVESDGAMYERGRAEARGKEIFFYEEWQRDEKMRKEIKAELEKQNSEIEKQRSKCEEADALLEEEEGYRGFTYFTCAR